MNSHNEMKRDNMHDIDEKDMEILRVLKQNSQFSIQKISKRTGIPVATVHNRIKKMKESGIITGYTIRINPVKLGRKMTAYVLVKATQKADQSILLHEIASYEHVEEGSMVTGEFDFLFKLRVKDMDELNKFVITYLRLLPTVAETRTMISYENVEK